MKRKVVAALLLSMILVSISSAKVLAKESDNVSTTVQTKQSGENVEITVSTHNRMNQPVGVTVDTTLPDGLQLQEGNPNCSIQEIEAGGTYDYSFVVKGAAETGGLSDGGNPKPGDNTDGRDSATMIPTTSNTSSPVTGDNAVKLICLAALLLVLAGSGIWFFRHKRRAISLMLCLAMLGASISIPATAKAEEDSSWKSQEETIYSTVKVNGKQYKFPVHVTYRSLVRTVGGGMIEGALTDTEGVQVYKGIPYAQAGRWEAPKDPDTWQDVKDCSDFGSNPMQSVDPTPKGELGSESVPNPDYGYSEDSFTVNVWTNGDTTTKKPVVYYIYGGAGVAGSSTVELYNGEYLASQDVVFVSVNYRLGIFGWFANEALKAENADGSTGNYGLMDLVKGLEWVQDNIEEFGGDPQNVTLYGGSEGALLIDCLMVSPKAQGLFAHADAMSYVLDVPTAFSDSDNKGAMLSAFMAMSPVFVNEDGNVKSIEELRAMPAEELQEGLVSNPIMALFCMSPSLDGSYLDMSLREGFEAGRSSDVDYITGINYNSTQPEEDGKRMDDSQFAQMLGVPEGTDEGDVLLTFLNAAALSRQKGNATGQTYILDFAHVTAGPDNNGAVHGGDLAYMIHYTPSTRGAYYNEEDRRVEELSSGYFLNFVRTGNPNGTTVTGEKLPEWEASDGSYTYFKIDGQCDNQSDRNNVVCSKASILDIAKIYQFFENQDPSQIQYGYLLKNPQDGQLQEDDDKVKELLAYIDSAGNQISFLDNGTYSMKGNCNVLGTAMPFELNDTYAVDGNNLIFGNKNENIKLYDGSDNGNQQTASVSGSSDGTNYTITTSLFLSEVPTYQLSAEQMIQLGIQLERTDYGITEIEDTYANEGNDSITVKEVKASEAGYSHDFHICYPDKITESNETYPMVVWCNGTDGTWDNYKEGLMSLASHGFIVIDPVEPNTGSGASALEAVDYMTAQNADSDSDFYSRVDLDNIGVGGHSQGADGAVNASIQRPGCFQAIFSGSGPSMELAEGLGYAYDISQVSLPIFLAATDGAFDTSIVTKIDKGNGVITDTLTEYATLIPNQTQLVTARRITTDASQDHSIFWGYMNAWFSYQLKGDTTAAEAFTGDNPELLQNKHYDKVSIR